MSEQNDKLIGNLIECLSIMKDIDDMSKHKIQEYGDALSEVTNELFDSKGRYTDEIPIYIRQDAIRQIKEIKNSHAHELMELNDKYEQCKSHADISNGIIINVMQELGCDDSIKLINAIKELKEKFKVLDVEAKSYRDIYSGIMDVIIKTFNIKREKNKELDINEAIKGISDKHKSIVRQLEDKITVCENSIQGYHRTLSNKNLEIDRKNKTIKEHKETHAAELEERDLVIDGLHDEISNIKSASERQQKTHIDNYELYHNILNNAGYENISTIKDKIIALIGDRDMYSNDAQV